MPYRSVYQNLNIIVVRIEVRFDQEHIKTLVLLVLTQLSCVAKERCRLFSSKKIGYEIFSIFSSKEKPSFTGSPRLFR